MYKSCICDLMLISCFSDFFAFFFAFWMSLSHIFSWLCGPYSLRFYIFWQHLWLGNFFLIYWSSQSICPTFCHEVHNFFRYCFFFLYFDIQVNFFLPSGWFLQRLSTVRRSLKSTFVLNSIICAKFPRALFLDRFPFCWKINKFRKN